MEEKDKQKQPEQPITEQLKEYVETYIKLARLKAIERGTSIFAGIVTDVFIILGLSIAFLFVSLTLAFYLADVLHSEWKGFGCVGLLYFVVIIIVMLSRKSIERPIINALLKRILK
jgi:hypothetical protein